MMRTLILAALAALFTGIAPAQEQAGSPAEEPQQSYATISYNPEQNDIFKDLDNMKVVYVANFWNTRRGTRLALRENILRPDSSRLMTAPLVKTGAGWKAELEIPVNASVLSYYITDGKAIDDNNGKTFTAYVYTGEGVPIQNAHYFMVPFLELAGASLEERLRESEREIIAYPKNFRAYIQYFQLYMEIERGSQRVQARIVQRLKDLEEKYGGDPDCLNLIARTYYYILRNQELGLHYKERIKQRDRWREVEAMFDPQSLANREQKREMEMEKVREELVNSRPPPVSFLLEGEKMRPDRYTGDPLVIIFWASSSERSKKLFGPLADLHEKYGGDGFKIIAVNTGETAEQMEAFRKDHPYPFIWAMNQGMAIQLYGVAGLPQAYVVDREGIIRDILVGYSPSHGQKLREAVEKVM